MVHAKIILLSRLNQPANLGTVHAPRLHVPKRLLFFQVFAGRCSVGDDYVN